MKYLSNIDATKAGKVQMPQFANLAAFPAASATTSGLAYALDTNLIYYSNGTSWVLFGAVTGAMTFKGGVAFNATEPTSPATGDTYVFTSAGSNTWEGTNVVEIGDLAIWNGSAWTFVQNNIGAATETVAGYVQFSTSAQAITGSANNLAVHPAGLMAALQANRITSVGGTAGAVLTGDGTTTTFAVVHTGKDGQKPTVRETTLGNVVEVDWVRTGATGGNLIFGVAPAATPTYTVTL